MSTPERCYSCGGKEFRELPRPKPVPGFEAATSSTPMYIMYECVKCRSKHQTVNEKKVHND
jgi:hypothetical protein